MSSVKSYVTRYFDAFEKTSVNLLLGDEIYYKAVTPLAVSATGKMDKVGESIAAASKRTTAETDDRIASTVTTQEIVAGAATLIGMLIAFFIGRSISKPLAGLTSGMQELAQGNFGVVLPGLGRRDEVGDMEQAGETFKGKAEQRACHEADTKMQQDQA